MRILHVAESFAAGVFEVVRTLSRYQRDAGHEVTIAFARRADTPDDVRATLGPGIRLAELPWRRRGPLSTARATVALRRVGTRIAPDVAHLHSSFAGLAGAVALPGIAPTVYTPHGYSILRRGGGQLGRRVELAGERWIASRVDAIGAVSEHEGRLAREVVGARRVVVIPNGIPELDGKPFPGSTAAQRSRPLVVTMGRITPARRPQESASVLNSVSDLADVLWIGDRIGEDRVTPVPEIAISGWLGREEALSLLGSATAYLHWSAWDGSPLAVLEALARDVVVVASDIPATRELLGPEQLCVDTEAASALLRRVLTDPDVRRGLLDEQARRRPRFGAGRMAADWQQLYRELIESGRID